MIKIQALSIQQPWAELIISGKKSIEIRYWLTDYRGLIWLHSGRKKNPHVEKYFGYSDLFKGGYIGIIRLETIFPFDSNRWEQLRKKHLDPGNYRPGLFAWILSNPIRFNTPVEGPGQLKLFFPGPDIFEKLINELKKAGHSDLLT
jgi:hypothetical protein